MMLEDVTRAIEQRALVKCKFGTYFLTAITSRYTKNKGWHYTLELTDRNANSVLIVPIQEVELVTQHDD